MADVVTILDWVPRHVRRQEAGRISGPAQLLFFTGVRYERLPPAKVSVQVKAVKKRAAKTDISVLRT